MRGTYNYNARHRSREILALEQRAIVDNSDNAVSSLPVNRFNEILNAPLNHSYSETNEQHENEGNKTNVSVSETNNTKLTAPSSHYLTNIVAHAENVEIPIVKKKVGQTKGPRNTNIVPCEKGSKKG